MQGTSRRRGGDGGRGRGQSASTGTSTGVAAAPAARVPRAQSGTESEFEEPPLDFDESRRPRELVGVYGFGVWAGSLVGAGAMPRAPARLSLLLRPRSLALHAVAWLVWALLPDRALQALGITYYPSKCASTPPPGECVCDASLTLCLGGRYWAAALPSYFCVALVCILVMFVGLNMMSAPPLSSLRWLSDAHARAPPADVDVFNLSAHDGTPDIFDIPLTHVYEVRGFCSPLGSVLASLRSRPNGSSFAPHAHMRAERGSLRPCLQVTTCASCCNCIDIVAMHARHVPLPVAGVNSESTIDEARDARAGSCREARLRSRSSTRAQPQTRAGLLRPCTAYICLPVGRERQAAMTVVTVGGRTCVATVARGTGDPLGAAHCASRICFAAAARMSAPSSSPAACTCLLATVPSADPQQVSVNFAIYTTKSDVQLVVHFFPGASCLVVPLNDDLHTTGNVRHARVDVGLCEGGALWPDPEQEQLWCAASARAHAPPGRSSRCVPALARAGWSITTSWTACTCWTRTRSC